MVVCKMSFQLEIPNEIYTGRMKWCLLFSLKYCGKRESQRKKMRGERFVPFVGCCSWAMGTWELIMLFSPLLCNLKISIIKSQNKQTNKNRSSPYPLCGPYYSERQERRNWFLNSVSLKVKSKAGTLGLRYVTGCIRSN